MCLDGTQAGLYFSKGFGDGANKTIVSFMAGGWCTGLNTTEVLNDCYDRSKSWAGSTSPNISEAWQDTSQLDWLFSGKYINDINFYNWNRFFFIYCDGTGHQGYLQEPI